MRETSENGRSETRENDGETGSAVSVRAVSSGAAGGCSEVEQPRSFRLRNLTGREFSLIFRSDEGTETLRRYPAEQTKIRVRYNRLFDSTPVESYADPGGSGGEVFMVESRPRQGILPTCETIDGLPPAEGGVRLVVDPAVVFGLARRGVFRRDLLTLGRVRKDPVTRKVVGFENLSRVNFDKPPDLAEVPALIQNEVWLSR